MRSVIKFREKTGHVVVDAEDALIAALKVKMQHPEALTCADLAARTPSADKQTT